MGPGGRPFLWSLLLLAVAVQQAAGLAIGDYRVDFDLLGGEGDLRPEQYREYIKSKTPRTPRGKYPSPLWYLYSPDLPKQELQAQLAELRYVEQQLGIKFWKVKVDNEKKTKFLKSMSEASLPPPNAKLPRAFQEDIPRVPTTPFFYNMITGKGIAGMTSSTNLKNWALGKDFKTDPWQGFTSPQFQDVIAKMGDEGEKEYMEKYSDHSWILRYRKERDEALKVHKRQYNRRRWLSKIGLARPLIQDEFERYIEVDRQAEHMQEERKGWTKRRSRPKPKIQHAKPKAVSSRGGKQQLGKGKKGGRQ